MSYPWLQTSLVLPLLVIRFGKAFRRIKSNLVLMGSRLHRRASKKYLTASRYGVGLEKILVLLTESGTIYTLLWVSRLCFMRPNL